MKTLFVDIGGVLATNPVRLFLQEFSIKNEKDIDAVVKAIRIKFKDWILGNCTEDDLWKAFLDELTLPHELIPQCKEDLRLFAAIDPEVLNFFKANKDKYNLVIASNNSKELMQHYIQKYNLGEIFNHIIFSADHKVGKPDEKFYELLLEKAEDKDDCILIDDKEKNLKAAEQLGIKPIKFTTLPALQEALRETEVSKK